MDFRAKVLILALSGLFCATAHAAPFRYNAKLDGASEAPPNASPATGISEVILDSATNTLTVTTSFSGLLSNTIQAHIHCCTATAGVATAGVAVTAPSLTNFPLGVTSGTYSQVFDLTQASSFSPGFVSNNGGTVASATAALIAGLRDGKAYLNIHTAAPLGFPGGEIRGFFQGQTTVPMPAAALWVLGSALGVGILGFMRRRAR